MDEEHSLSDAHIEKYMTEFELSKEQIIQLHEDFFGIQRKEMKCCLGSSTLRIGIVNNAFVAIAENGALENRMIENGCYDSYNAKFHEFLTQHSKSSMESSSCDRMKKQIHQAFCKLDKDNDGFITADELKQGIIETVEKKINYLVQEADVDGDGQISYYEFCLVNQMNPSLKTHQTLVSAKPLDGGWGWVVVFATFMCNFVIDGFGYSFGVLLNPLMESYDSNDVTISWTSSLYNGLTFLFGPIIGGLANRYGLRPICISGGIVCCIGLSISTLSPNVPVLMMTFGVIGGIGTGLLTLPANIAIGYYFESKRALATGITHCGSGIGQLILAPFMTRLLLMNYTWQTVVLIIGGFCLICSILGVLIRPLEVKKEAHKKTKSIWDDFRHILIPTLRLPLDDKKEGKSMWILIKEIINLELMIKPTFLLVCTSAFFGMIGFFVPLFFLPDFAVLKGIDRSNANFLISIYGISNIVSKLVTGRFSDLKCVNSFLVSNVYILICGVSVCLLPFCDSHNHFIVMVAFCGFFSTFFMLKAIVLVELVGLKKLTSAYSLIALFEGIGSIIGAPISRAMGNFDTTFYIGGGFLVLSSLSGFAAQILHRIQKNPASSQQNKV